MSALPQKPDIEWRRGNSAKGHKRTFAQIIQSARWQIDNTARRLAFCHAPVFIEINGAQLHRLLFHDGKPIGYATDCETITVRFQDMHGNTMRVFAYVRH